MTAMKTTGTGALICGATMLVIGGASALPFNAGHSALGGAAVDAANSSVVQIQCGPGGCQSGTVCAAT